MCVGICVVLLCVEPECGFVERERERARYIKRKTTQTVNNIRQNGSWMHTFIQRVGRVPAFYYGLGGAQLDCEFGSVVKYFYGPHERRRAAGFMNGCGFTNLCSVRIHVVSWPTTTCAFAIWTQTRTLECAVNL